MENWKQTRNQSSFGGVAHAVEADRATVHEEVCTKYNVNSLRTEPVPVGT